MVEFIREKKITIMIDTNKQTLEETFDNMDEAINYWKSIIERIDGYT